MPVFEILHKDVCGRIGRLETPHGVVETPAIMPVINPNIAQIRPEEMKKFGAEMIITNSYIIYMKNELRERALDIGLHRLLDFDGPIMTDSGSYQLSVYGELNVSSGEIIEFQKNIGSDIGVPIDIPTPPFVPRERAEEELKTTLIRAKDALESNRGGRMLIAGPVQGSTYPDLREYAARELGKLGFDIYPIGAVVPLMESYRYSDLVDVIVSSKKGLPAGGPVHLFGAGHPMMFALAAALGCDLFDSAAYALYAKEGRYITVMGTYHISDLSYLPCACPVCSSHNVDELKSGELLARHNLYVTFSEMRLVKQCIKEGRLWELAEQRCRSHPSLLAGLRRALKYTGWIEELDPISKSTFFYGGSESSYRAEVVRFEKRLDRFDLRGRVLIRAYKGIKEKYLEKQLEKENMFDHILELKAPFGAYPVELKETYPFNAEVPDVPDTDAISEALKNTYELIDLNPNAEFTLVYDSRFEHPVIEKIGEKAKLIKLDI